jgi:RNA polymerase sigma factor (sigma-70 family)
MSAEAVPSDARLVELVRAGDTHAFSTLFDRHRDGVKRICAQRLKRRSDVDDAVQEAFATALARLHQLRDPSRFGPWVRSIAVRACTDHHRSASRVIVLDDDGVSSLIDLSPGPDELLEQREHAAAVRATLSGLGERDRQALLRRHLDDAPVSAVAVELGLTEGSTRVLLTRARHRLRDAVKGLPVLLPPSWRNWLRQHIAAGAPAAEALAVAVVISVAAGGVIGTTPKSGAASPRAEERTHIVAENARSQRRSAPTPARRAAADAPSETPEAVVSARQQPVAAAPPARTVAAAPSRRPLRRVAESVDVERRYPDKEESQELVDVTLFANDDKTSVGLYADDVNGAITNARKAAPTLP